MLLRTRTWILGSVVLSGLGLIAACSSPGGASTPAATDPSSTGAAASPTAPSWAKAANYRGRVDGASAVSLQVHLALRDLAAAKAELDAVSDPANARYGHFLSDAEFAAKYAPTDADVAAVRSHLEANGLQVTEAPVNRAYLSVTGTATQVESAFGTRLGHYQVGSELRRAPMDPVQLPAAVSARIGAVLGLATPAKLKTHTIELSPDATAPACAEYTGQTTSTPAPAYGGGFPAQIPVAICGYKPAQLRQAYGFEDSVRGGNDGKGQKIAIVDAFIPPTLVADAQTYFANDDADYPLATSQITLVQGPGAVQPPNTGWYSESTLDVESVHAIAPGAKIVYVGAVSNNDTDLIAAINLIVTKRLATVVSNSYGGLEAQTTDITAWESMAEQAGLKGIGLYFSSGDNGDESQGDPPDGNGGVPTVDFPASLPQVTAVGGTSLALGATGEVLYELGWQGAFQRPRSPRWRNRQRLDAVSTRRLRLRRRRGHQPRVPAADLAEGHRPGVLLHVPQRAGPRRARRRDARGSELRLPHRPHAPGRLQRGLDRRHEPGDSALHRDRRPRAAEGGARLRVRQPSLLQGVEEGGVPGHQTAVARGGDVRHGDLHVRLPRRGEHQLHGRGIRQRDRPRRPERHEVSVRSEIDKDEWKAPVAETHDRGCVCARKAWGREFRARRIVSPRRILFLRPLPPSETWAGQSDRVRRAGTVVRRLFMRKMGLCAVVLMTSAVGVGSVALVACGGSNSGGGFGDDAGGSPGNPNPGGPDATSPSFDGGGIAPPLQQPDGSSTPPPATYTDGGCAGLQCAITSCSNDGGTTITGRIMDPAGANPLYNVLAYVPMYDPAQPSSIPAGQGVQPITGGVTFPSGVTCDSCSYLYTGNPIAIGTSGTDGRFTITNAPSGSNIPVVVQVGKWRTHTTVSTVTDCTDNAAGDIKLPGKADGTDPIVSIPQIAISMGGADSLECLPYRMGLAPSEFTSGASASGHIHVFTGGGFGRDTPRASGELRRALGLARRSREVRRHPLLVRRERDDEREPAAARAVRQRGRARVHVALPLRVAGRPALGRRGDVHGHRRRGEQPREREQQRPGRGHQHAGRRDLDHAQRGRWSPSSRGRRSSNGCKPSARSGPTASKRTRWPSPARRTTRTSRRRTPSPSRGSRTTRRNRSITATRRPTSRSTRR